MKKINFIVPFTAFARHSFLSDFAAVHTYITEVMPTGTCDKNLGWIQENNYFLFGTLSGSNSFLQNMEQTRKDPCEVLETMDFCMQFCGYSYQIVTENMKEAVAASIDTGYPVIAKMKTDEYGACRVLIGYDEDKVIIPEATKEQRPPLSAPSYEEMECLYVITGREQASKTLLDGLKNIEQQLSESIRYGAWTNSADSFDYFGKKPVKIWRKFLLRN